MKAWEENIRKVVPYVPGEQPQSSGIIKLNTNENPYPPAPGVVKALSNLDADLMRRYPDPLVSVLVNAIAEFYGLNSDQVFVGVGSDDVLAMAFLTCFNSEKPILFPDITYSFYDVWAKLFQIPYEVQPLDEDFCIRTEDYQKENGGIVFPNPNAPTGVLKSLGEIEDIIRSNPGVIVIVDEAYIDFGGESALSLLNKYDNLLIAQTFSKSRSMAGMRIGFLFGNPKLIRYINDCKYSFNSYTMNQYSLKIGIEAIKDKQYFEDTLEKIIRTREMSKKRLEALGFICTDSKTNFLFVTHKTRNAKEIFEALKEKDIYVRYFSTPGIDNYLRITIGTDEEMDMLIRAVDEILN